MRRCVTCDDLWPWPLYSRSFDLVLTWDPTWLNSVGNHEVAGGYPQNAGVLVVLVFSWYLHVWNGVAVARNPPACPAEKRSLGENLVNVRRNPAQVRLRTENGMRLIFIVWKICLGSASEPNICSHCYSVPYMKIPAKNQVILFRTQCFTFMIVWMTLQTVVLEYWS